MGILPPLAVLVLVASTALAAPPSPGDAAARLVTEDAEGRALAVPVPGRVTLLSFAAASTGEAAGEIARAIRVAHPGLEIFSFIDLSSFPRLLRGFARREIVKRQESALEATRQAFAKAGKTPPHDLAARIHVIPDFDAESGKAYGVGDTGKQPVMVLIGADGLVKAILASPSLAEVKATVAREIGSQSPH